MISCLITAPETFLLRYQMRPLRPLSDQKNPEDNDPLTFHVGTFIQETLVGVASFNQEPLKDFINQNAYRLRGMASAFEYQNQGVGRQTLITGLSELRKRKCDLLWCNARETAFPFYEKMGLKVHGPLFDIPTIGPHKIMYKHLKISLS